MIGQYAQQGPRAPWANHVLGHGGHPGTIGQFGCYVTTFADIATWAGYPTDPGQMDELFDAAGVFFPEGDGTYDLMPGDDNALGSLWPARFNVAAKYPGLNSAAIAAALPTPDLYTVLGLAWTDSARVYHTHFVPVVGGSGPDFLIGDSWDGVTKRLSAYGVGAVTKTVIIRALPQGPDPAIAAAAAAKAAADEKARIAAAEAASAAAAKLAAEQAAVAAAAELKRQADAAAAKAAADAALAAENARLIAEASAPAQRPQQRRRPRRQRTTRRLPMPCGLPLPSRHQAGLRR